jgi:hypothetical protein
MVELGLPDLGELGILFYGNSEMIDSLFIALIIEVGLTDMVMGFNQSEI